MPPKPSATKPVPQKVAVATVLPRLAERLEHQGILKAKDFKGLGLSTAQVPEALQGLIQQGFESIKGGARVALARQIQDLLQTRDVLPLTAAGAKLLKGTTGKEVKAVCLQMARQGELHWVLRGKTEAACGASTPVLTTMDLRALKGAGSLADKALKAASPKTLLRADVREELLNVVETGLPSHPAPPSSPHDNPPPPTATGAPDSAHMLALIRQLTRSELGFCFVPDLVLALLEHHTLPVIHAALREAAKNRVIELQIESGLDHLRPAELRLCPEGLRQSRLSWTRAL